MLLIWQEYLVDIFLDYQLILSNFKLIKVTSLVNMFSEYNSWTTLNLSNLNIINGTLEANKFSECLSLKILDLSNFIITSMDGMFYGKK